MRRLVADAGPRVAGAPENAATGATAQRPRGAAAGVALWRLLRIFPGCPEGRAGGTGDEAAHRARLVGPLHHAEPTSDRRPRLSLTGQNPSSPTCSKLLSRSTYEWQVSGEDSEPHFGATPPSAVRHGRELEARGSNSRSPRPATASLCCERVLRIGSRLHCAAAGASRVGQCPKDESADWGRVCCCCLLFLVVVR